jgi:hypothetical protein
MRAVLAGPVAALGMLVSVFGAQSAVPGADELAGALGRLAHRVEDYYARAQSIVALETVRIERQRRDMIPDGHIRRLVYELRVEWTPAADGGDPEAQVVRRLVSVDGRSPRKGDDDACMDPEPVSPEPMLMLLPPRRDKYAFEVAGRGRTDGRPALMLDYRSREREKAEVTWKDHCVSVSLPGWSRGRVWLDPDTHDVLRIDEHLVGMFEFPVPREQSVAGSPRTLMVERSDSSVRYQAVTFTDPEETLMLPRSIESVSVWRNTPVPRVRITQAFSQYRRFIGESRLVPDVR